VSLKVVENGGIVRSVRNHGIRDLPHRFCSEFPDKNGIRYYRMGRFVSLYYDSNPQTMREVETILKANEQVLRNTHLKARNKLWYVNVAREDKNPYMQRVMEQEQMMEAALLSAQQQQQQQDDASNHVESDDKDDDDERMELESLKFEDEDEDEDEDEVVTESDTDATEQTTPPPK